MDISATYHDIILAVIKFTSLSPRELHVQGGLTLFVGFQLITRSRPAAPQALLFVLCCELLNELFDRLHFGSWRWSDTLPDIGWTMLWPAILVMISLYRRRHRTP